MATLADDDDPISEETALDRRLDALRHGDGDLWLAACRDVETDRAVARQIAGRVELHRVRWTREHRNGWTSEISGIEGRTNECGWEVFAFPGDDRDDDATTRVVRGEQQAKQNADGFLRDLAQHACGTGCGGWHWSAVAQPAPRR